MRQWTAIFCVCAVLASSGCASVVESLINSLFHAASGESSQERADREQLEQYRETWSTPGRTWSEIDAEARHTFREAHDRDPNLNWHAR